MMVLGSVEENTFETTQLAFWAKPGSSSSMKRGVTIHSLEKVGAPLATQKSGLATTDLGNTSTSWARRGTATLSTLVSPGLSPSLSPGWGASVAPGPSPGGGLGMLRQTSLGGLGLLQQKREAAAAAERKKAEGLAKDLDSVDVRNRITAAKKLLLVDKVAVREHLSVLARRLQDPDMRVRLAVAVVWRSLPEECQEHAEALGKKMAHNDHTVSRRAALLLEQMGTIGAKVLSKYLDHHDFHVRDAAITAIANMGSEQAGSEAQRIIDRLDDENALVRISAAKAVGALGQVAAKATPMLALRLSDPSRDLREAAAAALAGLGPEAANVAEGMARKLDAGVPFRKRLVATASLPIIGERGAIALGHAMEHHDSRTRTMTSEVLGGMGKLAEPYIDMLAAQLMDVDPILRARAAEALGRIGPAAQSRIPSLTVLLWDSDSGVRRTAGEALERVSKVKAIVFKVSVQHVPYAQIVAKEYRVARFEAVLRSCVMVIISDCVHESEVAVQILRRADADSFDATVTIFARDDAALEEAKESLTFHHGDLADELNHDLAKINFISGIATGPVSVQLSPLAIDFVQMRHKHMQDFFMSAEQDATRRERGGDELLSMPTDKETKMNFWMPVK